MIVAGFGFRRSAGLASLRAALDLTGVKVDALATVAAKAAGLQGLAAALNLPLIAVTQEALTASARPGSVLVSDRYYTGSVAESAALAAAGPGARLTVSRVTSPDGLAVVAIAEGQP